MFKTIRILLCFSFLSLFCNQFIVAQVKVQLQVAGLNENVEILRDKWGLNDIYANKQYDLFFAQSYTVVQGRLFEFEV